MDTFPNPASGPDREIPWLDGRAPPAARGLLVLSRLDSEIEALRIQEMALVWRLEQTRRDAHAAYEEFRAQEMHVMFVESSQHYTAPRETLLRLREWLEVASQRCRQFEAIAVSEARETQEIADRLHRRLASLVERRRAIAIPPELRGLYQTSLSSGCSPEVVAVEDKACGGCGTKVVGPPPDAELRSCSGCRRVLYWRRTG